MTVILLTQIANTLALEQFDLLMKLGAQKVSVVE